MTCPHILAKAKHFYAAIVKVIDGTSSDDEDGNDRQIKRAKHSHHAPSSSATPFDESELLVAMDVLDDAKRRDLYARWIPIMQSSGMGKTRLLRQLGEATDRQGARMV